MLCSMTFSAPREQFMRSDAVRIHPRHRRHERQGHRSRAHCHRGERGQGIGGRVHQRLGQVAVASRWGVWSFYDRIFFWG